MIEKINEFIENCTKADTLRDRGLKEPDNIVKIENIKYSEHGEYGLFDIYYPDFFENGNKNKFPVIVHTHGGAYCYGSKEIYRFYCMSLAKLGFAVVNYNYRLTPKYHFPAPLEDLNNVLTKISSDKEEFSFLDSENIFLAGDSAGAQITSQYAVIWSNKNYAQEFDFKVPKINIRAIALNCGFYDIKNYNFNENDTMSLIKAYWDKDFSEYKNQLNVIENITKDYPPSFIMTSNRDFLNEKAKPFSDILTKNKVKNILKIYGDDNEELYHVFHCNIRLETAQKCNREECGFFSMMTKNSH
jgi:acetyl esterase/lipase